MPVTLPNGVQVCNVTPHDLVFYQNTWDKEVIVPSEAILNMQINSEDVYRGDGYVLVKTHYLPTAEGIALLLAIRRKHPNILIVGSVLAAQAYRGEVVAPVPYRSARINKSQRFVKSNRFTTFPQENKNGS